MPLYDQFDFNVQNSAAPNQAIRGTTMVVGVRPSWLHYPSSTMRHPHLSASPYDEEPQYYTTHYYGISGAVSINPATGSKYAEWSRTVNDTTDFTVAQAAHSSAAPLNGILLPIASHNISWLSDGTSNTVVFGEISWVGYKGNRT